MSRFKDFDEVWAERDRSVQPPTVKVRGKVYPLPKAMPAVVVVMGVRLAKAGVSADESVSPEMVEQIITGLFGKAALEAWLEDGITVPELGDIAKYVMTEAYAPEGEAPAPATGQTTTEAPSAS